MITDYIDIRDDDNHLLFKYSPSRNIVEIRVRGKTSVIVLDSYRTGVNQNDIERVVLLMRDLGLSIS